MGVRNFAARTALVILVLAAIDDTPMNVHAEEITVTPATYLTANGFSYKTSSGRDSFATVAASAELEVVPVSGPWNAGLFGEYHLAADERVDGTIFAGVFAGYRIADWDVTGYWFSTQYPDRPSQATLASRLRYQFRPGQKLGLEYMASTKSLNRGELRLGYYGTLSENLSTKLRVGTAVGNGWQPLAMLELSWQVQ